jgi:hypothetical protein
MLGDLSVTDILQMLIQAHKTGEYRVSLHDRTCIGSAYLNDGNIIHAITAHSEGAEALKELIQCSRGVFTFTSAEMPLRRTIQGSGISALLTASTDIDTGRPLAAA